MSEEEINQKNNVWKDVAVKGGVIVTLLTILGAVYTVGKEAEAREQHDKSTALTTENQSLKNEISKLQVDLNAANSSLADYKITFNSRLEAKLAELDSAIKENNEATAKAEEMQVSNNAASQKQKIEALIIETMQRYTELGVDMDHWDNCDKEYTRRYMQAKGLLDQISSLNTKYKISSEYSWFVTRQQSGIVPFDRKCNS